MYYSTALKIMLVLKVKLSFCVPGKLCLKVSDSETFMDSAPPKIFIWIQPSIYHNDTSVGQRLIIPVTTVEYYYMIILFQSSILVSSVLSECSTCKEVTGEGPLTGTYLLTESSGTIV
mgnify:CR=1 FL=1